MSDHDHPDHPELVPAATDEAAALALLDARGRRAAANLRTKIDALTAVRSNGASAAVGGGASPSSSVPPTAGDGDGTGDRDGDAGGVIDLSPARPPRPVGRRRLWLVAAVLLLAAGTVAVLALPRSASDGEGTAGEGIAGEGMPAYLVPGWTPAGWQVQEAHALRASDFPDAPTGTTAVYGDGSLADPSSGPTITVSRQIGGLPLPTGDDEDGPDPVTIRGRQAWVADLAPGTTTLWWTEDDEQIRLIGNHGIDRPTIVAAAEALVDGGISAGLPEGFDLLVDAPASADLAESVVTSRAPAFDGYVLGYAEPAPGTGQLVTFQQAADDDDLELLRFGLGQVRETEVRGLPAVEVGDQWFQWHALQWYEPSAGLMVTVFARDVDGSVLAQLAEGMRPAGPGELDALEADGAAGPFGAVGGAEVPVADGAYADGEPWRVVASAEDASSFELWFTDAGGAWRVSAPKVDGWPGITVGVGVPHDGMVAVFGVVTIQAGRIAVEAPGREPIELARYEMFRPPGWADTVFYGLVPADLGPAEVVATTTVGDLEFARASLDVPGGSSD